MRSAVIYASRFNDTESRAVMTEHLFSRPGNCAATTIAQKGIRLVAVAVFLAACGSPVDDSIDKLSGGPDERAFAKHELILAGKDAVEPIVAAIEDPGSSEVRPELAEVLVSMLLRSENERIWTVLQNHLLEDPDPRVRGRIADKLGLRLRSEYYDVFLQALSDPSPLVQTPILLAMSNLLGRLNDEQTKTLRRLAGEHAKSEEKPVREAALYLVEEYVARWAQEAREAVLKAELAGADSIYNVALRYAPASKQANYYLGRFYLEYSDRERGVQLLRENHLLFDVPRFASAPKIDGRLDDEVWRGAARIDSFYTHGPSRTSLSPLVQTRVRLGYSDEALYWGAHCFDAHPESLVVLPFQDGSSYSDQDMVGFRFDRNLDGKTISRAMVNVAGLVMDARDDYGRNLPRDHAWDAAGSAATHIGEDFWSVEFEFRWDAKRDSRPVPGETSGIDFVRMFRTIEWSQPFRGYDNLVATGYLLFQ